MYSDDLKTVALNLYEKFNSLRKVANLLNISYSTISRWKTKIYRPRKIVHKILDDIEVSNMIHETIRNNCFVTLDQLKISLENMEVFVCKETIRNFLKIHNYSKKNVKYYSRPSDYETKLENFIIQRQIYTNENRNFISIDETSFGRNYAVTKGYSKKGDKIYAKRSCIRTTNITSVAAMTPKGVVYNKIKGACNSILFLDFLKSLDLKEKDVILMDNVSFHHSKLVKEYLSSIKCDILYNVPYSPIFNPIEGIFSIVKRKYYKCFSIEDSYKSVTLDHISSFFKYSMNSYAQF